MKMGSANDAVFSQCSKSHSIVLGFLCTRSLLSEHIGWGLLKEENVSLG